MSKRKKPKTWDLIIGGKCHSAAEVFEVPNPADGQTIGLAPKATVAQLDQAVSAAAKAFEDWQHKSDARRRRACSEIADKIEANAEELAQLLTLEQGKPLNGLGSRWEVGGAVAWARATAALELPMRVLQDNPQGRVELHRRPIGVVGSITPWNFPLMIAVWHILPAVRAGNTVVCKPSPQTPLSTLRLVELMNEVLPKGVVNAIAGGNELGERMSVHPDIGKIVFTGSCATGQRIMASAAPTLKRLTLELGGNDAGIVLPDVDPRQIAEGLFWGAFINGGQTCAALKRLYVHDDVHDAVCEELVRIARTMKVGDGRAEDTQIGPVQNRMQWEKVNELVEDAKKRGARVLLGGQPPKQSGGHFYPLTLVADVRNGIRLVDEEQFGPVLPIIRYSKVKEAIQMANDSPNGLGGSVWSRDLDKAKKVAGKMQCGSVWINKHGMIQPNVPFSGTKQSGIGVEFADEGLHEYTTLQAVFA